MSYLTEAMAHEIVHIDNTITELRAKRIVLHGVQFSTANIAKEITKLERKREILVNDRSHVMQQDFVNKAAVDLEEYWREQQ